MWEVVREGLEDVPRKYAKALALVYSSLELCCCLCCMLCFFFPFILDVRLVDVPAGVIQEEGHTGFLIHHSFCGACLNFTCWAFLFFLVWKNSSYRNSNSRPNVSEGSKVIN